MSYFLYVIYGDDDYCDGDYAIFLYNLNILIPNGYDLLIVAINNYYLICLFYICLFYI